MRIKQLLILLSLFLLTASCTKSNKEENNSEKTSVVTEIEEIEGDYPEDAPPEAPKFNSEEMVLINYLADADSWNLYTKEGIRGKGHLKVRKDDIGFYRILGKLFVVEDRYVFSSIDAIPEENIYYVTFKSDLNSDVCYEFNITSNERFIASFLQNCAKGTGEELFVKETTQKLKIARAIFAQGYKLGLVEENSQDTVQMVFGREIIPEDYLEVDTTNQKSVFTTYKMKHGSADTWYNVTTIKLEDFEGVSQNGIQKISNLDGTDPKLTVLKKVLAFENISTVEGNFILYMKDKQEKEWAFPLIEIDGFDLSNNPYFEVDESAESMMTQYKLKKGIKENWYSISYIETSMDLYATDENSLEKTVKGIDKLD